MAYRYHAVFRPPVSAGGDEAPAHAPPATHGLRPASSRRGSRTPIILWHAAGGTTYILTPIVLMHRDISGTVLLTGLCCHVRSSLLH